MFKWKKVVTMVIALLIVGSFLSPDKTFANKTFSDVKQGSAHHDGIHWLVTKGIDGYPNGTFGVNEPLSRPHTAVFFSKALELELPTANDVKSYFNDVNPSDSYAAEIAAVGREEIFTGSNGQFMPNNQLSREQMATTLVNAFDLKNNGKNVNIRLDNVYSKHRENVQIIANLELTDQLEDYRPREAITRGQFASLLYRIHQLDNENPEPAEEDPIEDDSDQEEESDPQPSNPGVHIIKTNYGSDFKAVVDAQMRVNPQTDSAGSWYHASRALLEYYANPNNFQIDSAEFYQFLLLSGSAGISEKDLNERVLANQGVLAGRAADFIEASQRHNVNEIYLIAHALHETKNGTSTLATGVEVGLDKEGKPAMVTAANRDQLTNIKKTYNFYGIGAFDRCPLTCGSERAYAEGWFTYKDAIIGGARFINNGYISAGQDTLYKMRWNPARPATHQYATDVGWAVKQTSRIERVYELYNDLDNISMTFDVPVYQNMPAGKARPTGAAVFHVNTNYKHAGEIGHVTASMLNFRTGPTTRFTAIRQLPKDTLVTIIGENSGWYKIRAGSDEGWVSASYIEIGEPTTTNTLAMAQSITVEDEQHNELTSPVAKERVIGELVTASTLFQSPTTGAANEVISELSIGTKVDIVAEKEGWFKVEVDGEQGWIKNETMKLINVLQLKADDATVPVKAEANEASAAIGELLENETIIIVPDEHKEWTIEADWYKVYYEGRTGWIHKSFVK